MYLYETHFHTSEVSPCGYVPAREGIRLYRHAGYSGVLVTDHYNPDIFGWAGLSGKKEINEHFLKGYHAAKEEGKGDIAVMLGAEFRYAGVDGVYNEFLLVGLTEDFLSRADLLYTLPEKELKELLHSEGILIVQAHPFRPSLFPVETFLDGVEVYNGNPRHNSYNDKAEEYAEKNNIRLRLSGSDFHMEEDVKRGGIILSQHVSTSVQLAKVLREGGYRLYKHEA